MLAFEKHFRFHLFIGFSNITISFHWKEKVTVRTQNKHEPPERFPDTFATRMRNARSPATMRKQNYLKGTHGQNKTETNGLVFFLPLINLRMKRDWKHKEYLMLSTPYLHLSCQVLVLVPDDWQGRLLTQGVGSVSEGLLWSRRRGRTADLLITQTVAAFVGAWGESREEKLINNAK